MSVFSNKSKKKGWVSSTFDEPVKSPPNLYDVGVSSSPQLLNASIKSIKRNSTSTLQSDGGSSLKNRKQYGGSKLWCDDHVPREELAVHKKKVQEVEDWLIKAFTGHKGHRILVLTGPVGCGKTACVRALAGEMGVGIKEWINTSQQPRNADSIGDTAWVPGDSVQYQSQSAQFHEFVLRVNKYGSVVTAHVDTRSLLLVEDVPNVFYREPDQFHDVIRRYTLSGSSPAVFVMSDSPHREHTARHLFPPSILATLPIATIQFNAVAVTLVQKALGLLVSRHGLTVSDTDVSEMVATAQGDIRTAVNVLQFTARPTDRCMARPLKTPSRSTKRKRNAPKAASNTTEAVGTKDTSLLMFRALGKILYCKRTDSPAMPLAPHLRAEERSPALENAEAVLERSCLTPAMFLGFLHQNWQPFMKDVTAASTALQYLADADVITGQWTERDTLGQYSSVGVRGVMHVTGGSSGAFRALNKPAWGEVQRSLNSRLDDIKAAYQSHQLLPLATDIIPYAAKINARSTDGNSRLLQDIGRLSGSASLWTEGQGAPLQLQQQQQQLPVAQDTEDVPLDYDSDISDASG